VKAILQAAVTFSMSEARSVTEKWQHELAPQNTSGQAGDLYRDSAEAIRADQQQNTRSLTRPSAPR